MDKEPEKSIPRKYTSRFGSYWLARIGVANGIGCSLCRNAEFL